MTITIGRKLGHYKIQSLIGAGGMGEVYLAKDTRLERIVALKILPSDVASNEERMRRFVQEAKAAAALNHPIIAHIYEIGEADATHFIAMEYIEGVTLTEKIHREKTPLKELLKYLTQVAEGLAKAHRAGIVHRDLKPDNIIIERDGYAKILDFGLAKLVQPQNMKSSNSESSGETATAILEQHSIPGMVMGTAGYMSPEQAQGKVREIDHRSDIFSFGCILYEAATRQKAFEGKDQIDSLHKIVHAPTPQIKDVNPDAPADLQRIIRRCLAKDPEERYQSIKDAAIELKELRQELKEQAGLEYSVQPDSGSNETSFSQQTKISGSQLSAADTAQSDLTRPTSSAEYLVSEIKSHKKSAFAGLLLLVIALGGIGYGFYKFWSKPDKPAQAIKIERLTTNGKSKDAAISPDGKYVVYVLDEGGQQSLWARQVATSSNVQIIAPADVQFFSLTFTPDSNYVSYIRKEKNGPPALYQMPLLGGAQKKLISDVNETPAVSYSPDGKQLAFVRGNHPNSGESVLMIASADGNEQRIVAKRDIRVNGGFPWWSGQGSAHAPAWSPDGKTIACVTGGTYAGERLMNVVEIDVATGAEKPITTKGWYEIRRVAWLKDKSGLLILGADQASSFYTQQIWHVSYPDGDARRLTADFNNYIGMSLTADSGALAAVQSNRTSNIWVAPGGDAARAVQVKFGGSNDEGKDGLAWTPDGRIVYYSRASGADDIWIMNGDGSSPKQLTVEAGANYDLEVTPDGRYIIFTSERGEGQSLGQNLWRMDLDGGNPRQLTTNNSAYGTTIALDSQWVTYTSQSSGKSALWKVSINGGESTMLTDISARMPQISPDGKLIACEYSEGINMPRRHALIPVEGGKPIKVFDLPIGVFRWSPDGRALNYLETRGGVTNIWSFPLDGSPPKQLTDFKSDYIYNFKWSPDGKNLLLSRGTTTSDVVLIRDFK